MKKTMSIKVLLAAMVLVSAAACATTTPSSTVPESIPAAFTSEPSTNSTAASPTLMQRLQKARAYDLSNSTAFTRSAPSLDHYFSLKAEEVTDVMRELRAGQEVPQDDINRALDNGLASTFGVPVP
jgi:predicted component of type VI protein secretion system